MKRKTQQFLRFADQLDKELDKNIEIFLKQRPFLENKDIKPEILEERSDDEIEEKITNDFAIKELIEKIRENTEL